MHNNRLGQRQYIDNDKVVTSCHVIVRLIWQVVTALYGIRRQVVLHSLSFLEAYNPRLDSLPFQPMDIRNINASG